MSYDKAEAKTFQDWVATGTVEVGDEFLCVYSPSQNTFTEGKIYKSSTHYSPPYDICIEDNWEDCFGSSGCVTTRSKFVKLPKKKEKEMLKSDWSLDWTAETAEVIVKALVAVGVPVYPSTQENPKESQEGHTYLVEATGEACGGVRAAAHHFKHLEDFLAWYFKPEKSQQEIEMENLGEQIKQLQEQYNKLMEEVK